MSINCPKCDTEMRPETFCTTYRKGDPHPYAEITESFWTYGLKITCPSCKFQQGFAHRTMSHEWNALKASIPPYT